MVMQQYHVTVQGRQRLFLEAMYYFVRPWLISYGVHFCACICWKINKQTLLFWYDTIDLHLFRFCAQTQNETQPDLDNTF